MKMKSMKFPSVFSWIGWVAIVLLILAILPGTAVIPVSVNNTTNQTSTCQITGINISGNASPMVSDNFTGNLSPDGMNPGNITRIVTDDGLIEGRLIGPGLPPKGWVPDTNLPNMSDNSTKIL